MQVFLSDEFVQYVSNMEDQLSEWALFPEFIMLDKHDDSKIGPYTVSRIWFDYQDDKQQLGITYLESSVKNNKQIEIFKAVRSPGVPLAMIPIWIKNLYKLLTTIRSHRNTECMDQYYTETTERDLTQLFQEMSS